MRGRREAQIAADGADRKARVARQDSASRPDRMVLGRALMLGLAYGAANLLVTLVTSFGTDVGAVFWPGAGLTVALLLLRPRQEWPVLVAAVFVAEVTADLLTGFGAGRALAFGVANCSESVLGAALVLRGGRARPDLARVPDLLRFAAGAVLAGPAVGALVGTALPAALSGDPWLPRLPRWFVGDAVGVLVVAPFLLTRGRRSGGASWPVRLGPAAALLLTAAVAAGPWSGPGEVGVHYLVIPALVLVALRLRTGGAATGVLAVGALVETVTAAGFGPFADDGPASGLLAAEMFLVMCAFTALTVAALTTDLLERERAEAVLRSQALHDSLTGLANRRLLYERLGHALARLTRRPGLTAVIAIDLDGFKAVNDTWSHAAGDAVLVATARRIEQAVRTTDTAARLGGDEFLVLAEDLSSPAEAEAFAARLAAELSDPIDWEGLSVAVGASVGVAYTDQAETDPAWLVGQADRLMYQAKRRGEIVLPAERPVCMARLRPMGPLHDRERSLHPDGAPPNLTGG